MELAVTVTATKICLVNDRNQLFHSNSTMLHTHQVRLSFIRQYMHKVARVDLVLLCTE